MGAGGGTVRVSHESDNASNDNATDPQGGRMGGRAATLEAAIPRIGLNGAMASKLFRLVGRAKAESIELTADRHRLSLRAPRIRGMDDGAG
jgi:hypothetical protein